LTPLFSGLRQPVFKEQQQTFLKIANRWTTVT
jgi:hypothetical protein